MLKKYRGYLVSFVMLASVLIGAISTGLVVAHGQNSSPGNTSTNTIGSAESVTAPLVYMHTVNMHDAPAATAPSSTKPMDRQRPLLTGTSAAAYAQIKAETAHNPSAPFDASAIQNTSNILPDTPPTINKFNGMADSPSICPPTGCEPPDMAIAASTQ
ncbi:MAG TPA: hypothetical protein VJ761_20480, partial [Ktedonobacteraceae bacterium]|nr:hypothetical protein [Ktedonobacteraceae bacterium]